MLRDQSVRTQFQLNIFVKSTNKFVCLYPNENLLYPNKSLLISLYIFSFAKKYFFFSVKNLYIIINNILSPCVPLSLSFSLSLPFVVRLVNITLFFKYFFSQCRRKKFATKEEDRKREKNTCNGYRMLQDKHGTRSVY